MYAKWENFQTSAQTVPALNGPFTSKAMKESDCPYPAEFCVPLPMVEVAEVMGRFCVPKMQMFAKDASGAVVPTAAAVTPESFDGSGKSVIGDFIADQRNSWQATVIVAFASAIVAFLFMILLRYFVGCVIWGMIALIFLVLVAGGLLLVLYSVSCTGQSIIESGTKIANSASSGDPTAVNAFYGDSSCSNGKAVKDPAMRDVVKYIGYGFFWFGRCICFDHLLYEQENQTRHCYQQGSRTVYWKQSTDNYDSNVTDFSLSCLVGYLDRICHVHRIQGPRRCC